MRTKSMSRRLRVLVFIAVVAAVAASVSFATTAIVADDATTIQACANQVNGALRVVTGPGDCRHEEQFLSWPAQATGGGALAFAHINGDGTLDAGRSKNVTSSSLVTGPVFVGDQLKTVCISLDGSIEGQVKNVVVQRVGLSPIPQPTPMVELAAMVDPTLEAATGCPTDTDAVIVVGSLQLGTSLGRGLFVLFN